MPLGQRTDCGDARYAGVEVAFAADIAEKLEVRIHQMQQAAAHASDEPEKLVATGIQVAHARNACTV